MYGGSFVAERYAAVGEWIDGHPDDVDPVVGPLISEAANIPASQLAADIERLERLKRLTHDAMQSRGVTSLMLPTAPLHPTIREVAADPVGLNVRLGRFTSFVNLLDLCAVAVPAGEVGGLPFGVSFIGPAWTDNLQCDLARLVMESSSDGEERTRLPLTDLRGDDLRLRPPALPLVVVGAHLSGQPLNEQLTSRGARFVRSATTSNSYALYALDTQPPKPGLVRVEEGGTAIEVEEWELPPAEFAQFVASLPSPMVVGPVHLGDGRSVTGFLCEPIAVQGAADISTFGGWRAYLSQR